MKKIIFLLVIVSFLVVGVSAMAEEPTVDPGILPDSTFYFLKTWKESIQTFFVFGAEKRANQYLHLAEVRMAEYQKMMEIGKEEIAQKTLEKYEKQLNYALQKVEELKNKGKETKVIFEKIIDATSRHMEVLQTNFEKVSDGAKEGIENAIENSQKGNNEEEKEVLSGTDEFARCLSDKGVKMYGAYWCSHCINQKNMFGESMEHLPYIECAIQGSQVQESVCRQAGITGYPTWVFPGGEKVAGELSLEKISKYSGCELR